MIFLLIKGEDLAYCLAIMAGRGGRKAIVAGGGDRIEKYPQQKRMVASGGRRLRGNDHGARLRGRRRW
jgi:hypothetical protein